MNKSKLNKKVMLFSIILVFVMCLGCASASENIDDNSTDEVLTTPTEDVGTDDVVLAAEDTDSNLGSDDANDILNANIGTFTELNATINNPNSNGIIKLTKDYAYDSTTDAAFLNGININNSISINGLGHSISGSGQTRIFNIYGSDVLIKDTNFINGYSKDLNGGAINWQGEYGQVLRCTFENNVAGKVGSTTYSRATIAWLGAYGKITNSYFINNEASNSGILFFMSKEGTISGSTFFNNSAYSCAGINIPGSDVKIYDCTFKANHATDSNGAMLVQAMYVTVENCIFDSNHAKNYGALYVQAGADNFNLKNCIFNNNVADNSYGAFGIAASNCYGIIVDNCNFTNNKANSVQGGAGIFNTHGGSLTNCLFENNTAATNGGGLYISGIPIKVENCIFKNNVAGTNGGGIYSSTSVQKTINCTFINNRAVCGGAIYTQTDVLDCYFENNTASAKGGALYTDGSYGPVVLRNTFVNNHADVDGGAVAINAQRTIIGNCEFISNDALHDGGSIYGVVNYVVVKNSNFEDSHADNYGGAIYCANGNSVGSTSYFTEFNCSFSGGFALVNSSDMYVRASNAYIGHTDPRYVNASITQYDLEIRVFDSTSNDAEQYGTLEYAFKYIANGGTIYIESGTYTPTAYIAFSSKSINLIGIGSPIIDFNKVTSGISQSGRYSVFHVSGPDSYIEGITFRNNNLYNKVAYAEESLNNHNFLYGNGARLCVIYNCTFDATGTLSQGGRYWKVINCTFKNNVVPSMFTNYQNQEIINCTFIDNSHAGIRFMETSFMQVVGCKFIRNSHDGDGGGIWMSAAATYLNVSDCTFINNSVTGKGGGINTVATETSIAECTFEGNVASNGGAVYSTNSLPKRV